MFMCLNPVSPKKPFTHIYKYLKICACMDAWMDGWMHAWMHGWMDVCMCISKYKHTCM